MIKCTVFDWGDRCKNINGHLHEYEEYLQRCLKSTEDEEILAGLNFQLAGIAEERKKFNAKL